MSSISQPTPCFVLEEEILQRNLQVISTLKQQTGIKYLHSLKAFSNPEVLKLTRSVIDGASASSLWEAKLGFQIFSKPVHTYAPAYSDSDWKKLSEVSSHITFNSLPQLQRFGSEALASGHECKFGLRVNPECSVVTTAIYNPADTDCRLGINSLELGESMPKNISGLHVHALCESDAADSIKIFDAISQKFDYQLRRAKWLNLGGGHLLTRADYKLEELIAALNKFQEKYPNLSLIMEPGAATVWNAGYLAATILDILKRPTHTMLMLDVSFAAHMPDCLEMPYRPRVRGTREPEKGEVVYRLGGQTCLAGDQLGDYAFDTPPKVGDTIILEDMMHYTMVKTTMFNGVKHPAFAIRDTDGNYSIIRQYDFNDYLQRAG